MRLDKFICEATELTRTLAKRAIRSGDISCDGVTLKSSSFKVNAEMQICLNGELIEIVGERYIMLNKPVDTICSTIDEVHPSVISLLDVIKADTLHIAGRLDVDTTGLVLITSDGQWSHKVTSPKKECGKRYLIEVAEEIDSELVEQFSAGISLKGEPEPLKPAQLEIIDIHTARLTITEGKYHQVKRMFAATGNKVISLHREAVGRIELDSDLEEGEWRYLTEEEVNSVK